MPRAFLTTSSALSRPRIGNHHYYVWPWIVAAMASLVGLAVTVGLWTFANLEGYHEEMDHHSMVTVKTFTDTERLTTTVALKFVMLLFFATVVAATLWTAPWPLKMQLPLGTFVLSGYLVASSLLGIPLLVWGQSRVTALVCALHGLGDWLIAITICMHPNLRLVLGCVALGSFWVTALQASLHQELASVYWACESFGFVGDIMAALSAFVLVVIQPPVAKDEKRDKRARRAVQTRQMWWLVTASTVHFWLEIIPQALEAAGVGEQLAMRAINTGASSISYGLYALLALDSILQGDTIKHHGIFLSANASLCVFGISVLVGLVVISTGMYIMLES